MNNQTFVKRNIQVLDASGGPGGAMLRGRQVSNHLHMSPRLMIEGDSKGLVHHKATMCSGSGMAEVVHHCLMSFLGQKTIVSLACESNPWKRKHLRQTVHPLVGARDTCTFHLYGDLVHGSATCCTHGRDCAVDLSAFIAVAGYSCKDLSKLRSSSCTSVLPSRIGSSGETCQNTIDFMSAAKTPVIILENVEEMAKSVEDSTNVAFLHSAAHDRGYVIQTRLMWASEYMLPQKRKRSWAILLHLPTFQLSAEQGELLLNRIFQTVASLKVPPMSLAKFFLSESHPRVRSELERMRRSQVGSKGVGLSEKTLRLHREYMASKGVE